MANNCYYEMVVFGTKENCNEWLNRMRGEDCSVYKRFYRVFDSDVIDEGGSDKNYFMHIVGDCAWSLYCCGRRDEPEEDLFAKTTAELSMVMEAYSSEPGMGFQEHFIYDNGEMIADECKDYTEVCWDSSEFERIEDFIKEWELTLTEEDFDEDGIARIGGFGEDWGDFTYKRLPDLLHPFRDYNPDNEHCFEDSDESIMSLVV